MTERGKGPRGRLCRKKRSSGREGRELELRRGQADVRSVDIDEDVRTDEERNLPQRTADDVVYADGIVWPTTVRDRRHGK